MNKETKRPKPKFTLEFKQDAAKLVIEKGYTHQQASDNLGVSFSALGRWVRAERGSKAPSETKQASLNLAGQSELVQLRKENEQLRMEREILLVPLGYPRATEDVSCDRVMQSDGGQHQCLSCLGQHP